MSAKKSAKSAKAISLHDILSTDSGRTPRRRVGRGLGSGLGKTGGRGSKGEGSRTGGKNRGPLFEGGQFPFWMRLPKRGFGNEMHATRFVPVSIDRAIARVEGTEISNESLAKAGLIQAGEAVKLVGGRGAGRDGSGKPTSITKKYAVRVERVTASVKAAITAAGGTVTETAAAAPAEA